MLQSDCYFCSTYRPSEVFKKTIQCHQSHQLGELEQEKTTTTSNSCFSVPPCNVKSLQYSSASPCTIAAVCSNVLSNADAATVSQLVMSPAKVRMDTAQIFFPTQHPLSCKWEPTPGEGPCGMGCCPQQKQGGCNMPPQKKWRKKCKKKNKKETQKTQKEMQVASKNF